MFKIFFFAFVLLLCLNLNLQAIVVDYKLYIAVKNTDVVSDNILRPNSQDFIVIDGAAWGCWIDVNPNMEPKINLLSQVVTRKKDGLLQVLVRYNHQYDISKDDIFFPKTEEVTNLDESFLRLSFNHEGLKKLEDMTESNIDGFIVKVIGSEVYGIEHISEVNRKGTIDIPIIITKDEIEKNMGYGSIYMPPDKEIDSSLWSMAVNGIIIWCFVLVIGVCCLKNIVAYIFGIAWGAVFMVLLRNVNANLKINNGLLERVISIAITDIILGAVAGFILFWYLNNIKKRKKGTQILNGRK